MPLFLGRAEMCAGLLQFRYTFKRSRGGVSMTGGIILPVLRSCLWSSGREKGGIRLWVSGPCGEAEPTVMRIESYVAGRSGARFGQGVAVTGERHAFLWAGRMVYGAPPGSREMKTGCVLWNGTPFFSSLLCLSF